jgi:predicted transcriptional regulator
MATTTIRVDVETRDRLRAIAEAKGRTLSETTRDAAAELERAELIREIRESYARLRADPEEWADYLAELESFPAGDDLD